MCRPLFLLPEVRQGATETGVAALLIPTPAGAEHVAVHARHEHPQRLGLHSASVNWTRPLDRRLSDKPVSGAMPAHPETG